MGHLGQGGGVNFHFLSEHSFIFLEYNNTVIVIENLACGHSQSLPRLLKTEFN